MNERHLVGWLAAEREGNNRGAEALLAQLFRALPQAVPSPGFADRILVGAGLIPSWRTHSAIARSAIAGSLVSAGLAAAFLLPVAVGLVLRIAPGDVLSALAGGFMGTVNVLGEAFSVWRFMVGLRETLWLVLVAPPVATTLLAMTAVAALALHGLTTLLSPQRSSGYA